MQIPAYWVYIVGSPSGVLYVGMTSDLRYRISQHKTKAFKGFTARYNCHRLLYHESFRDVWAAIKREKQIKGYRREKKENLINQSNPAWQDLYLTFEGVVR